MKHYKKFYEIGNNRYYTLDADNETFIATESFINFKTKNIFKKIDDITQGLKLLKLSTPIAILFNELNNIHKIKGQKNVDSSLLKYEIIDNIKLKEKIANAYNIVFAENIKELDEWIKKQRKEKDKKIVEICEKSYKNSMEIIKRNNPLNTFIDIKNPKDIGCMIVKTMIRSGLEHLYTEKVTAFANNVYLYEQDCFGTLTIYRIMTVKNVVKSIDTFIYDRNLISTLLKTMYENNN